MVSMKWATIENRVMRQGILMNFRSHSTCLKLVDTFNLSRHAKYEPNALRPFTFFHDAIHTFVLDQLALFCYL